MNDIWYFNFKNKVLVMNCIFESSEWYCYNIENIKINRFNKKKHKKAVNVMNR